VAPALPDTNNRSLNDLMKNLRDLVNRTRAGTLRSSELSDSTITVTNLGEQSVETVFGVIYPPQVAIVGFGKIYEDVSVVKGRIKGCYQINASLSADHRVSDGHRGAMFLAAIEKLLQEPEKL
jgi:pyruvate dehydrogenase E2 component (dihydrolipoamide acetyltransferase)